MHNCTLGKYRMQYARKMSEQSLTVIFGIVIGTYVTVRIIELLQTEQFGLYLKLYIQFTIRTME